MWIRSQDKLVLAKVTRLSIVGTSIQNLPTTGIEEDSDLLGEYENFERAVEVLDDIQRHLANAAEITKHLSNWHLKQQVVYQMPEE
mgnify:CR=1 FL=1